MDSGQYGEGGKPPTVEHKDVVKMDCSSSADTASGSANSQSLLNNPKEGNSVNNVNLISFSTVENNKRTDAKSLSQDTGSKNSTRVINTDRRYGLQDKGPFHVFIEHTELNLGNLHPMKVGRILNGLSMELQSAINEVKTVGRNRVKIEVKSAVVANLLVTHDTFKNNKMIAYIPQHLTEKKAVIRGVDTSISEAEIVKNIKSVIPVLEAKRLTRVAIDKDTGKVVMGNDGKPKKVPRQMILLTFQGRTLPEHVYIDRVRCQVERYVPPVIQCFNCLLYGHTKTQCRGKMKCRKCGKTHDGSCQEIAPFCIHCKNTNHSSISKACPLYSNQQRIKVIMTDHNLTFKEAEKLAILPSFANIVTKNKFSVLQNNSSEFPSLPSLAQVTPKVGNSQPNPRSASASGRPSIKRKKPQSPLPHSPPVAQSSFHFCGPPILNNPFTFESQDITATLTNSLVEFVAKLVADLSGNGNCFNSQEIERHIQNLVKNTIDNKLKQNTLTNVNNSVEC